MRLGVVNVDRMLRCLTAKQFRAWEMYDEIDPIGDVRGDYHAAQIVSMMANLWGRSKGQQPYKITDFLLPFGQEEKPKQTPQQQFAMLKILAAMHAGDATPQPDMTPPDVAKQMSVLPPEIKAKVDAAMKRT